MHCLYLVVIVATSVLKAEIAGMVIRVASTVDAVLLSHSDTLHLGALPYAMKQFGISAPIFATEPVYRLGLLTMYDHYLSRKVKFDLGNVLHWVPLILILVQLAAFTWFLLGNECAIFLLMFFLYLIVFSFCFLQQVSEFDLFTLDDIDSAFQNIIRLTYSQNYYISGKLFYAFLPFGDKKYCLLYVFFSIFVIFVHIWLFLDMLAFVKCLFFLSFSLSLSHEKRCWFHAVLSSLYLCAKNV